VPLEPGSRHSTRPHHGSDSCALGDRVALGSGGRRLGAMRGPGPAQSWRRGRRIEWTLANQNNGGCFSLATSAGVWPCRLPPISRSDRTCCGIVSDTSDLISNINEDFPSGAQVDGVIGAETLAGTSFEIGLRQPAQGRWVAACEPGTDRQTCWAAPVATASAALARPTYVSGCSARRRAELPAVETPRGRLGPGCGRSWASRACASMSRESR